MCKSGKPSGERVVIKGVSYDTCSECRKPVRGTGQSLPGIAVFVCKDFVRKGKRVPFSDDWIKLCEACGFRLVCRHRAMLVKKRKVNTLFGVTEKIKEKKSFFRRLHEKKPGAVRIDWEDVICVQKVGGSDG